MTDKKLVALTVEAHAQASASVIKNLESFNVSESEMAAILRTASSLMDNQIAAKFSIQIMHQQLFSSKGGIL